MAKYTLVKTEDAEGIIRSLTQESGLDADEWAMQSINQLQVKLLTILPVSAYLSMGPYWWPVKRILSQSSKGIWTDPADDQVNEISLGRECLDVAAAMITRLSQREDESPSGLFELIDDNGNATTYQLSDLEWEQYRGSLTYSPS